MYNAREFVKLASSGGYASRTTAKAYVEESGKSSFDMDDFVGVHHKQTVCITTTRSRANMCRARLFRQASLT